MKRICLGLMLICLLSSLLRAEPGHASGHAVIIQYHHVGNEKYPTTNIRLDQFDEHLRILRDGGYNVLPIGEIVDRLKEGGDLPEKTVGITFDDAYTSIYTNARPRLEKAGYPYTVFVGTDVVDAGARQVMTWEQIRELARGNVTIGNHSASHFHCTHHTRSEVRRDLQKAENRIESETGLRPLFLAYPYGEYDKATIKVARKLGIKAAFAQIAGVVDAGSNFYALPRFPLNEHYGSPERFRMILEALPFNVKALKVTRSNPPKISFRVSDRAIPFDRIRCFPSNQTQAIPLTRLSRRRLRMQPPEPFPEGSGHVNCTAPCGSRYYWLGIPFFDLHPCDQQ